MDGWMDGWMDGRTDEETPSKKNKENKRGGHLGYIPDMRKFWQYLRANGTSTKIGNELGQGFEKYERIQRQPCHSATFYTETKPGSPQKPVLKVCNTLSFRTTENRMQCGRLLPAQLYDIPWPYKCKHDFSITFTQFSHQHTTANITKHPTGHHKRCFSKALRQFWELCIMVRVRLIDWSWLLGPILTLRGFVNNKVFDNTQKTIVHLS